MPYAIPHIAAFATGQRGRDLTRRLGENPDDDDQYQPKQHRPSRLRKDRDAGGNPEDYSDRQQTLTRQHGSIR